MSIRKNDEVVLSLCDMNNLGAGIAHTEDGMAVFVMGGVTGDRVRARVIKVAKTYAVARLEEVIEPSPYRCEESFCGAPASCGGCCYRNIKYSHELELKREHVASVFRREGLSDVEIEQVRSVGEQSGYRNKAQYPVRQTKNGMRAGFFASKTHDLIPADRCMLQPSIFSDIVKFVLEYFESHGLSAYDEESGGGLLRHIYLRRGKETGEIMLCLVINADKLYGSDEFACEAMRRFGDIVSCMININKRQTNVILGDRFECIGGRDYILDRLCGLEFIITAGSFYQVNHDAAELLYTVAKQKAALTGREVLADLYCGTGTIGLSMAQGARALIGVEIVGEAVECARKNAERNGIENAYFFCGDASDTRDMLSRVGDISVSSPDVAVIDPPRKGTTAELMDYLNELGVRRIVYISCAPDTLARDCAYFRKLGYEIGSVTPVDMFPRTGHVESVVLISK